MLFGVFGPKLAKESPCGHQLVNSNIAFYHPPLSSNWNQCELMMVTFPESAHPLHYPTELFVEGVEFLKGLSSDENWCWAGNKKTDGNH